MFIKPVENIVTPQTMQKLKFISGYELIPAKVINTVDVVADRFVAREKELLSAPQSVVDSITRIFW